MNALTTGPKLVRFADWIPDQFDFDLVRWSENPGPGFQTKLILVLLEWTKIKLVWNPDGNSLFKMGTYLCKTQKCCKESDNLHFDVLLKWIGFKYSLSHVKRAFFTSPRYTKRVSSNDITWRSFINAITVRHTSRDASLQLFAMISDNKLLEHSF